MADTTQQFIDNLITIIDLTTDPESITNEMLARVLYYLNDGLKSCKNDVEKEIPTIIAAIHQCEDRLNTLVSGDASEAIDNYNEILHFLEGIRDSENILEILKQNSSNKIIELGELDTMGTGGTTMAHIAPFVNALNRSEHPQTHYAVTSLGKVVGVLDIFTDDGMHVLTQVFETHETYSGGKWTGHHCGELHRYWRSYNIASPNVNVGQGEWTEWRPTDSALTQVASEEEMAELVAAGNVVEGQMYYSPEED